MTHLVKNKRCPTCGGIDFTRRHRSFWMRWFSNSQFFVCRHCRTRVLWVGAKPARTERADHLIDS